MNLDIPQLRNGLLGWKAAEGSNSTRKVGPKAVATARAVSGPVLEPETVPIASQEDSVKKGAAQNPARNDLYNKSHYAFMQRYSDRIRERQIISPKEEARSTPIIPDPLNSTTQAGDPSPKYVESPLATKPLHPQTHDSSPKPDSKRRARIAELESIVKTQTQRI